MAASSSDAVDKVQSVSANAYASGASFKAARIAIAASAIAIVADRAALRWKAACENKDKAVDVFLTGSYRADDTRSLLEVYYAVCQTMRTTLIIEHGAEDEYREAACLAACLEEKAKKAF